ncbi:amidohydrolase family protein [Georgenia sp. Z1491]|uniref:amidohydrolase family protein n=1 Tax=Georgenia sp. Z1491 TaxID=3416707 RepID=UPI003CE67901
MTGSHGAQLAGPVVDLHAHVLLPELSALAARLDPAAAARQGALDVWRQGEESIAVSGAMLGDRLPRLTDVARRLADMDTAGVDVQVVSASPNHYAYFLGEDAAREYYPEANRLVAAHVAEAPDRLLGLGLVPLQHPKLAADVLRSAVRDHGLRGVEIGSFAPRPSAGGAAVAHEDADADAPAGARAAGGGAAVDRSEGETDVAGTVELSDPALDPFWAAALETGAVILLHPFGSPQGSRLDRYNLSNTVAQPAENATALSHLIFSGVLDRHPGLALVAAHAGGYLPTAIGRSDRAWRVRPEARTCARTPSSYLSELHYDSLTHDQAQLAALVAQVGADRVALGSDHPFDMGEDDPVAAVRAAHLSDDDTESILRGTAAALGLNPRPTRR